MALPGPVAAWVTVTEVLPDFEPLLALTVNGPPMEPAVNSPLELMLPPPVVAQVNPGWGASTAPNWSLAAAANCCVAPD